MMTYTVTPVVSGKSICIDLQGIIDRIAVHCSDNVIFLTTKFLDPFWFQLIALSGWMSRQRLQLID